MTSPEARRHGGHVCPWWLIRTFDNPLRRLFHDPEALLRGLVSPGDRCLDFGCGFGYFTVAMALLAGPSGSVTALDVQPQMLEGVKRRVEKAGVKGTVRFHLAEAEGARLREPCDFVLAFWSLHEVPEPEGTLREVARVLVPGGRFLLVEPRLHVREREFEGAAALAEASGLVRRCPWPVALSRAVLFQAPGGVPWPGGMGVPPPGGTEGTPPGGTSPFAALVDRLAADGLAAEADALDGLLRRTAWTTGTEFLGAFGAEMKRVRKARWRKMGPGSRAAWRACAAEVRKGWPPFGRWRPWP